MYVDGQIPTYQSSEHHQSPSTGPNAQPGINIPRYRRSSSHLAGPPISYTQYPSSNFSAPLPQYGTFGTPFAPPNFQDSFQQQAATQQHPYQRHAIDEQHHHGPMQQRLQQPIQQSYAPVPSQSHHFAPIAGSANAHAAEEGDNSDGGVPVPPDY